MNGRTILIVSAITAAVLTALTRHRKRMLSAPPEPEPPADPDQDCSYFA